MQMPGWLKFIFNIVYLLTIAHIWYIGFLAFKKRGLYTGDLPDQARELLDWYSSHTLNCILHMIAATVGMPSATIFCLIGMGKDMQSKPLTVNALLMSIIISCNCFLLNVHEWLTAERTF